MLNECSKIDSKVFKLKEVCLIVIGSVLFCTSINLFIVPHNLYNPGGTGVAQVIRTIIVRSFHLKTSFDVAGIINFLINIPLYLLAFRSISKRFLVGTILSVIVQTVAFSFIRISNVPIVNDVLASCVIGGVFSAVGIGCTLIAGASGGGTDILGVYASIKWKNFTIGKLTIMVNAVIYIVCAIIFDFQTAVYSIIYAGIFSFVLDKVHLQNIEMYCMVFTKNEAVKDKIVHNLVRGLTYWNGIGGYTDNGTEVIVTIVSKYEITQLKNTILETDPHAFVIISEDVHVIGNFEKRLIMT